MQVTSIRLVGLLGGIDTTNIFTSLHFIRDMICEKYTTRKLPYLIHTSTKMKSSIFSTEVYTSYHAVSIPPLQRCIDHPDIAVDI